MYRRRQHETPELRERIMLYRQRAKQRQPLFQGEGTPPTRWQRGKVGE
jgi:hypothetical protein